MFFLNLKRRYDMSNRGEMIFRDTWGLSYQGFGPWDTTFVVGDIRSAQTFWQMYNHTPNASLLLVTTQGGRVVTADPIGNIRSIFLFRECIKNKQTVIEMGAPGMAVVYRYQVSDMTPEAVDYEWEELQLAAVGESCNCTSWALSGVRILDRTKRGDVAHRFELWCGEKAEDVHTFAQSRAALHGVQVEVVVR